MRRLARTRASSYSRFPSPRRYVPDRAAAVWLAAILIIGVIYYSPKHIVSAQTAVTLLLAAGIVLTAARWPDRSLIVLITFLPFQGLMLALLYRWGMPTSIVRHLSAWKESLALGVVIAGARCFIAEGRRADALDRLGLGFVLLAAIYLAMQTAIIPSAPSSTSVKLLGFRQDAGFVLLLLGARHARLGPRFLDRAGRVALLVAAVVGGIGIFEALDPSGWNQFVVGTVRYTFYEVQILHTQPLNFYNIIDYGTIGGTTIIRIGSVFLSPLSLGFYLVLGFAVGLERVARGLARPWVMISLLVVISALLLSQTRSAILAALIVTFLATRPKPGDRSHWRAQLALVLAAVAVIAVPTALATGLGARLIASTSNPDNAGHLTAFATGISTISHHPLGLGLGTSAGTGQRFQASGTQAVVPENNYLQLGVELGIAGMLLFIAITIAAVRMLRRVTRVDSHHVQVAAGAALAGLAVGAWFLQTWTDFSVAWTVWGLAGASLAVTRSQAQERARIRPASTLPAPPLRPERATAP
jgi:hypothetical protein